MKRDACDAAIQASTYSPRPGIGVVVIVTSKEHPDCVIIGKRKSVMGDLYQLPGGKLEFGETWEDAASREVYEETGIHITDVKFCHVVNSLWPEINYHFVTIVMKGEVSNCGATEPENKEPDKCKGWQWIQWDKFPEENQLLYALRDFRALKINPFKV